MSKILVKFGLILSELSKTVRFKLAVLWGSFLWWQTTSDGNEPKSNLDRFDETKIFRIERFFIRGHLEGQIAHAKQQIVHASHQTYPHMCLVPGVIFCSLEGLAIRALTSAYDLGLRRSLYQNRSFRRDAQLSCWNFLHLKPYSLGYWTFFNLVSTWGSLNLS